MSQHVNGAWSAVGSPAPVTTDVSTAYTVKVQAWGGHVRVWRGTVGQPQTLLLDLTGVTQSGSSNLVLTVDSASGYLFGQFDVRDYYEAKGTYRYDALGRRIQSQTDAASATTTNYVYDGWQTVEERDGSDAVQAEYVYGAGLDEPLTMRRGGQDYYYHADELGNVLALTDSAGQLAEKYSYGPYGQPEFANAAGQALPNSALGNPLLFNGREYDPTLKLYNYRMRWLDPRAGRFTTRDPMGAFYDASGLGNPFAYVGNSPWMYTDPYGLAGVNDYLNIGLDLERPNKFCGNLKADPTAACDSWQRTKRELPLRTLEGGVAAISGATGVPLPYEDNETNKTLNTAGEIFGMVGCVTGGAKKAGVEVVEDSPGLLDKGRKGLKRIGELAGELVGKKEARDPFHHIFPQRADLAEKFRNAGITPHDFTIQLKSRLHIDIHSGGPRGGDWNKAWEDFFKKYPDAEAEDIYREAGRLFYEFELPGGPIVPYPRR